MRNHRLTFAVTSWCFVALLVGAPCVGSAEKEDPTQALFTAADQGNVEQVRLLIKAGASVHSRNELGYTPLIAAAERGHTEVVAELLASGADVNASAELIGTALMMAAHEGHLAVVELLLRSGANPFTLNRYGWSALIGSLYGRQLEVAAALVELAPRGDRAQLLRSLIQGDTDGIAQALEKGLNTNLVTQDGVTLLTLAAAFGRHEIVGKLAARGADVNRANTDASTALMAAAVNGQEEAVKVLIGMGANVNAADTFDNTALYLARANGHEAIARLLEERGAQ